MSVNSNWRTEGISRKGFLASALVGAVAFMNPRKSSAQEILDAGSGSVSSATEADMLWQKAVEKAHAEGSSIHYNIDGMSIISPRSHITGVTNDMTIVYKGIPGVTRGVAAYNAYPNGNIDTFYGANIETGSGVEVQWCQASYTIIDSGQTLAVTYSCSLYWPGRFVSVTCHFYAEFWSDGSGYLTGGPVA